MGDFDLDTAVDGGDGEYTATLSRDWEIWGPNGGYVAAVLLRAAGAHSAQPRPASLAVHFLGSAAFDEVQIRTETLRAGRRSESVRVSMRQGDAPIAEALVWTVAADTAGPELDLVPMPDVPGPDGLPLIQELIGEEPQFKFWKNFEFRPLGWLTPDEWAARTPDDPRAHGWFRFSPTAAFDDPYLEAGRVTVLLDTEGWPALVRGLAPEDESSWIAPNMDVHISFHHPPAGAKDLYFDIRAPISTGGLAGAQGSVWSADGRLLGTGIQQMLFRNVPNPVNG